MTGHQAVITGGASGIGLAAARAFAEAGAEVAVLDRDVDAGQAVAERDGFAFVPVDVTDPDQTADAIRDAAERLGGLTTLVNNAGASQLSLVHETRAKDFRTLVEINLLGTFHAMHAAIPLMLDGGRGCIINNASGSASRPTYGELAYSSAKAGVVALTRGAAQEYGPAIRVNSVSPGVIRTPMSEPMFAIDGAIEPTIEATPLGRVGMPDDVADVMVFLASDQSRFITGQDIVVDGGLGLAQAGIDTTLRGLVDLMKKYR